MVINVELKKRRTMKKTYINPELNVFEIKPSHQLLAGSTESLETKEGAATEWGAHGDDFDWDEEEY